MPYDSRQDAQPGEQPAKPAAAADSKSDDKQASQRHRLIDKISVKSFEPDPQLQQLIARALGH